jgi:hypothetical protein
MATADGTTERDRQIASLRARGYSNSSIASTFDLTERHVRRILAARPGRSAEFFDLSARERLSDLLEVHDSVVEDAALEAIRADSPADKVRALDVKLKALDKKKDLLEQCGLMPHFEPPSLDQAGELGAGFLTLLQRHGARTQEIEDELFELLEAWGEGRLLPYLSELLEGPPECAVPRVRPSRHKERY